MSRIIIKGLPKYLTEDRLKDHFATKGEITDVKLRKNFKGESRRFAFIGFKNVDDADNAVKFFDGSFIDTSKIEVSVAKSFVDPTVPKSFKEKKKEAFDRIKENERRLQAQEEKEREYKKQKLMKKKSKIDEEIDSNPKLKEFMEAMKPASQTKSWSNDVVVNENNGLDESGSDNLLLNKVLQMKSSNEAEDKFKNDIADEIFKVDERESDDEYDDFGGNNNKKDDEPEEKMFSLNDLPQNEDENNHQSKDENMENKEEEISDLEWLKRRRIRVKEDGEIVAKQEPIKEDGQQDIDTKSEKPQEPEEPEQTEEEKAISKIQQTSRLFLRNISYDSKEADFRELFSPFGELEEVHVATDTRTGKSKGFCYVQYQDSNDAIQAYIELDKQIFQGRLLHILPGEEAKTHKLDEYDLKNLPLKKQRELKKKYEATKSQFSWNSLFLNNDAVMDTIASDLKVDKRDLLDPENSNSAVKQALAEAHVLGDIRKFFENQGIDLTKFKGKERDDTVILIKNIPFGTAQDELLELFQPFGEIKRFIIPPSGTIAIIQFRDVNSGKSAFSKLSYRRFGKSILYLEKGPIELFTREPTAQEAIGKLPEKPEEVKEIPNDERDQEDVEVFEGSTVSIFIKNLNFGSQLSDLKALFDKLDGFLLCTIKTKPDPRDSTKRQSMGFGFAEFKSKDQALTAIKVVDGKILDGHKLQLKLSHRENVINKTITPKAKGNSKIIVKNLPFEATRKDIFDLFNSFGQLKTVRVPKKFDKSARGFAFVEFLLQKEAEMAMDQLQGVHLLGRKLILQYAESSSDDVEAEIEKLNKKARKQENLRKVGNLNKQTKRKLDLEDEDEGF